jgi:hypothetical protein
MENTNVNPSQNTSQGDDFSDVMKMFDDYEKKSEDKPKQTKEDILSKYFTPRNSVENFRILPPLQGRDIIEKAFFHYVPVNKAIASGKGRRKIYCPAHNSPRVPKLDSTGQPIRDEQGNPVLVAQRCPLCERAASIKKNLDNSIKYIKKEDMTPEQLVIREKNSAIFKEAGQWEAKKYYIVRGIDKGKAKDGIKYWRFKHNFKNQGVLDKLVPALKLFHEEHGKNPTDVNEGSDLYINVVDSSFGNIQYKDVSSITAKKPTPLYDDPIVVKQWLSDTSTWRDVYKEASMTRVLTSEQYLDRVAAGTDPYWDDRDQDNKRYVFPDPADAELMAKANEKTESLDSDSNESMEMASDVAASSVIGDSYSVGIGNVTSDDVGGDVDNSVDVGAQFTQESEKVTEPVAQEQPVTEPTPAEPVAQTQATESAPKSVEDELEEYDDLPF